jgi:hypothetical protein
VQVVYLVEPLRVAQVMQEDGSLEASWEVSTCPGPNPFQVRQILTYLGYLSDSKTGMKYNVSN